MSKKVFKMIVITFLGVLTLTACGKTVVTQNVSTSSVKYGPGELYITSVTHNADRPLKKGDTVHIKVEVENYNPEMQYMELYARIANQPGQIPLRNDGTLGDTTPDDQFYEGEYTVGDESKPIKDGTIIVNTYRQQIVAERKITIEP